MPPKEYNPYKNLGLSIEEVFSIEHSAYTVQVGDDFMRHEGRLAFNKRQAVILYNKVVRALLEMINSGSKKESAEAKQALMNVHINPVRIH